MLDVLRRSMIPHADLARFFPAASLFAEKEWRWSPEPFRIGAELRRDLEKLGHRLLLFVKACNELYHRSHAGKAPAWVAQDLDRGKPAGLLDFAREKAWRGDIPLVLRPDLVLTDEGFTIAELDSVPGGIGLTAWLNQTYSRLGQEVIGGERGMLDGFHRVLGSRAADVLVSRESATYRPEMEWLARELGGGVRVLDAETYQPPAELTRVYRFFELFDLPNLPAAAALLDAARAGRAAITPPLKPWMEEKAWSALFWSRPLREFWRRELSDNHFIQLQRHIPQSWLLDPTPLPHHAVIPGLEINDWRELAAFSQKQRELVLKISGFSELAWGSRSVVIGSDVAQPEWESAVAQALADFERGPWVLQRFAKARIVEQPVFDADGSVSVMRGKVRLCPYYFIHENRAELCGALATICPPDKKVLHGMRDAILAPTAE